MEIENQQLLMKNAFFSLIFTELNVIKTNKVPSYASFPFPPSPAHALPRSGKGTKD